MAKVSAINEKSNKPITVVNELDWENIESVVMAYRRKNGDISVTMCCEHGFDEACNLIMTLQYGMFIEMGRE